HVELAVRIARIEQRLERARDVGLLERRHQMDEDRRAVIPLERRFVRKLRQPLVRVLDEATGGEHPFPVDEELEGGAAVTDEADEEEKRPVPLDHFGLAGNFRTVSPSRT